MFYNSTENELIYKDHIREDFVERVYVDWPEINNDEFRFISSRMEDMEDDNVPVVFQPDTHNNQFNSFNIDQLKISEKPPIHVRYESMSKKNTRKKLKDSSIPPLDLISQNSSIDIGTKGVIDIDLRSSSESLSEGSQGYVEDNLERDSLDTETNDPIFYNTFLNTTLPEVKRSDLVINHREFDSSRYNLSNSNSTRKLSEITVLSQCRPELPTNEKSSGKTNELPNQRLENEKAAFEAARQRYKISRQTSNPNSKVSQKSDSIIGSQNHKLVKTKPTLLVAPQIKQQLHNVNNGEKATNFIEFNKIPSNVQKQAVQSTYASKYIDRYKKESSSSALKRSPAHKDQPQLIQNHFPEKYHNDPNQEFPDEESMTRKFGISDENLNNDHFHPIHNLERPYQVTNPNGPYPAVHDAAKLMNPSSFLCAYNQYGDPVLINTDAIIPAYGDTRFPTNIFNVIQYQNSGNQDSKKSTPSFPCSPQTSRKLQNTNHVKEISRSVEFDSVFKDAAFKRQPTLYDENLLMKKLKQIKTSRTAIKFPPIPNCPHSSDSSINLSANAGYAANHRRKESSYEQYTLRDFRNLKQIDQAGGLGPNIGTDSYKQMKEKLIRQKNYAEAVQEKNRQNLMRQGDRGVHDKSASGEEAIEPCSPLAESDSKTLDEDVIQVKQEVTKNCDKAKDKPIDSPKPVQKGRSANQKLVPLSAKDQLNKRDAMLLYAKAVKEKQIKKRDSKPSMTKAQSAGTYKEIERNAIHELFSNSDLDRLVLRHENDKRMVEQISQKLGKIS